MECLTSRVWRSSFLMELDRFSFSLFQAPLGVLLTESNRLSVTKDILWQFKRPFCVCAATFCFMLCFGYFKNQWTNAAFYTNYTSELSSWVPLVQCITAVSYNKVDQLNQKWTRLQARCNLDKQHFLPSTPTCFSSSNTRSKIIPKLLVEFSNDKDR